MPDLLQTQAEDVQSLTTHKLRAIVANAPGTGKTATTIRSLLLSAQERTPALIIVPASVLLNWEKECVKWAPSLRPTVLESDSQVPSFVGYREVYMISWAMLATRKHELQALPWKCIVADEAHYAKNPDAARSDALRSLCAPHRGQLFLTGTPIVNNIEEMEHLKSFFDGEEPLLIRRLLSEVAPNIPPKTRSYVYIDIPPKFEKEYAKAEADFEGWLRDAHETLVKEGLSEPEIEKKLARQALVKIGYLRRLLGEAKVFAAADFAARTSRIGEPLVMFCDHQVVVHNLSKALRKQRIRHGIIDGNATARQRQELIELFQKYHLPVIICTKAGSTGITLHAARHLLFIERFYTAAEEDQAEDRIRRIGQKHATIIWRLHVPGTVDDRVDEIVNGKRQIVAETIGDEAIAETAISNVESLVRSWSSHTKRTQQTSELGLAAPLPAIPSPSRTAAVYFSGPRWNEVGARLWCRMHGFPVERITRTEKVISVRVHGAHLFRKGTFMKEFVARDIQVITADRVDISTKPLRSTARPPHRQPTTTP